MGYGIKVIDDRGAVQLDAESRLLTLILSGEAPSIPWSSSSSSRTITFPRVITTMLPPLIFIRPLPSRGYMSVSELQVTGSPGAWTGFKYELFTYAYGRVLPSVVEGSFAGFEYFAAAFVDSAPEQDWGLAIWDASSKPVFKSEENIVILTGGLSSAGWVETTGMSVGSYYYHGYYFPWTGSTGDYVLANGLLGGDHYAGTQNTYLDVGVIFMPSDVTKIYAYMESAPQVLNGPALNGRTFFAGRPVIPI